MDDWIEKMRLHVEEHFGDRIKSVRTSERDHGGAYGIAILLNNGWRHALVTVEGHNTSEEVIRCFEKWLEVKQAEAMRFVQLASGVDMVPVLLELNRAAHLWDRNPERRLYPGTPHAAMTDITVRYMPEEQLTGLEARRLEHRNVFWPAWYELQSLRPLIFALMNRVACVELGSILLTKLPPGADILPHTDAGSWAPEYYNCKAHLTLAGTALVHCCEAVQRFDTGTIWTFDNLRIHSITNDGAVDRIVCIVSMRCE